MAAPTPNLQEFIITQQALLESNLERLLPKSSAGGSLVAAMRYSCLNGGKRLRPLLVYATGLSLNVSIEKLHAAATSVELIHCYSLIHDDLPAMDDDDLRRGIPTCHKAFDEATAILAGDALQSLAFEVLADPELNPVGSVQQIAMVQALARASGGTGMILGQAQDLAAETKTLSLGELTTLHANKTGALFKACVELALLTSDKWQDTNLRQSLFSFAENIGLGFQIQDDILDLTGDETTLGKPIGSDLKFCKATFPSLLGLDQARQAAEECLAKAQNALSTLDYNIELLSELAKLFIQRIR